MGAAWGRVRRGFTLVEAVVVVVVLGLAVPPTLMMIDATVDRQIDSLNVVRATTLATALAEQVIADASSASPGLGLSGVSASDYATKAGGLNERLSATISPYQALGFSHAVSVGGLVSKTGAASGTTSENVFRLATVTVSFPSVRGGTMSLDLSALVSER